MGGVYGLMLRVIWRHSDLRRCRLSHVVSSEFVSDPCHFLGQPQDQPLTPGGVSSPPTWECSGREKMPTPVIPLTPSVARTCPRLVVGDVNAVISHRSHAGVTVIHWAGGDLEHLDSGADATVGTVGNVYLMRPGCSGVPDDPRPHRPPRLTLPPHRLTRVGQRGKPGANLIDRKPGAPGELFDADRAPAASS